jgi:hypothetical protein
MAAGDATSDDGGRLLPAAAARSDVAEGAPSAAAATRAGDLEEERVIRARAMQPARLGKGGTWASEGCPRRHWLCCLAVGMVCVLALAVALRGLTPLDTINGVVFAGHHGARHVMRLGKVEEWTILQVDGVFTHPFHLHVNHVQLTEAAASHRFGFAIGEYYDVVAMPMAEQRGKFKVRFRPADFTGDANVVIHCHLLAHEDGGMMILTSIVP